MRSSRDRAAMRFSRLHFLQMSLDSKAFSATSTAQSATICCRSSTESGRLLWVSVFGLGMGLRAPMSLYFIRISFEGVMRSYSDKGSLRAMTEYLGMILGMARRKQRQLARISLQQMRQGKRNRGENLHRSCFVPASAWSLSPGPE